MNLNKHFFKAYSISLSAYLVHRHFLYDVYVYVGYGKLRVSFMLRLNDLLNICLALLVRSHSILEGIGYRPSSLLTKTEGHVSIIEEHFILTT